MKHTELQKLVEQELLVEANEGDIAEGLFAIGLCLLLGGVSGKEFWNRFDSLRREINPDERYTKTIVGRKWSGGSPPDYLQVDLELKLKSAGSCDIAFGKTCLSFKKLPPTLQKKMKTIERDLFNTSSVQKLLAARDEFLNNTEEEFVKILVLADGTAGESTGGKMKGDVGASISVGAGSIKNRDNIELIRQDAATVNWSIKSGSRTAGNLSPRAGMLALAKEFRMNDFIQEYKDSQDPKDRKDRFKFLSEMWNKFVDDLMKTPESKRFDNTAYKFITDQALGEDAASVLAVEAGGIKEFTRERIETIKNDKGRLRVEEMKSAAAIPRTIIFLNVCPNDESDDKKDRVFSLRIKVEGTGEKLGKAFKFMVEFGGTASQVGMTEKKFILAQAEREERCGGLSEPRRTGRGHIYGKGKFTGEGEDEGWEQKEHLTNSPLTAKMLQEMIDDLLSKK